MLGEDQPSWLCLDSDPFVTEQWIQMGAEHVIDESWCEVPCQIVSLFCKQVGGIWPNYNPQRWISSGSFHVESSARYAHRFCINIRSFARAIYCDVLFDLNSAGPSSWDWWSCNPVHLRRWITFLRSYGLQTRWLVSGRVWCIRFSSEFGQRIMPHCSMDCLKMSQEWEEKMTVESKHKHAYLAILLHWKSKASCTGSCKIRCPQRSGTCCAELFFVHLIWCEFGSVKTTSSDRFRKVIETYRG